MNQTSRLVRRHWKLLSIIALVIVQLIAIASGWVLFRIGGDILIVSLYSEVTVTYKVWQKRLAYLWQRLIMRETRRPLATILARTFMRYYPEDSQEIIRLADQYTTFDTFRARVQRVIFRHSVFVEEIWKEAIQEMFGLNPPSVSVVVPIYDIEHEILDAQVASMAAQSYPGRLRFYLTINDAEDLATRDFLQDLIDNRYHNSRVYFEVIVEGNPGKRKAQYTGFQACFEDGSDIIGNMDGDGFADPDCIWPHVWTFLNHPEIGLTTGDVRVSNMSFNLLTILTGLRYHVAFWDERAAQSWTREMICGSGPNLFIRPDVLRQIIEPWYHDQFAGIESTYGDDRDLTLKSMEAGFGTVFVPDSIVWTDSPTQLKAHWNQQKRWNKSAIKYNIKMYLSGLWNSLSFFVRFSVAYLMFYPFVVVFAIAFVLARAGVAWHTIGWLAAWDILRPYTVAILIVGIVFQSLSGLLVTGDRRFFLAPLYILLWFRVQLPLKFIAPWDLRNPNWGTRKTREEVVTEDE